MLKTILVVTHILSMGPPAGVRAQVLEVRVKVRKLILASALGACALSAVASDHRYRDPADVAALPSAFAARTALMAVTLAGPRIVAVGLRGHIVYSDDDGKTWTQANVPVSTDLVAVSFADARRGWAVGHGGVVIASADGGSTWTKQMDGKRFSEIALAYYRKLAAERPSPEISRVLQQAQRLETDDTSKALLDVYFESANSGYVVGTFNRIFHTWDGGKTWLPLMDRTGNSRELHFYSIRRGIDGILLTGEQGMVWKMDPANLTFESKPTPYKGTLFGSVASKSTIFVFGMRGSLFRSGDQGTTWTRIELPIAAGITGGVADGGKVILASQAGTVLISGDDGASFKMTKLARPMSYFGAGVSAGGKVAFVGSDGVAVEVVSDSAKNSASKLAN